METPPRNNANTSGRGQSTPQQGESTPDQAQSTAQQDQSAPQQGRLTSQQGQTKSELETQPCISYNEPTDVTRLNIVFPEPIEALTVEPDIYGSDVYEFQGLAPYNSEVIEQLAGKITSAIAVTFEQRIETISDRRVEAILNDRIDSLWKERFHPALKQRADTVLKQRFDIVLKHRMQAISDQRIENVLNDRISTSVQDRINAALDEHFKALSEESVVIALKERVDDVLKGGSGSVLHERIDIITEKSIDTNLEERIDAALKKRFEGTLNRCMDAELGKRVGAALGKQFDAALDGLIDVKLQERIDALFEERSDAVLSQRIDDTLAQRLQSNVQRGLLELGIDTVVERLVNAKLERRFSETAERRVASALCISALTDNTQEGITVRDGTVMKCRPQQEQADEATSMKQARYVSSTVSGLTLPVHLTLPRPLPLIPSSQCLNTSVPFESPVNFPYRSSVLNFKYFPFVPKKSSWQQYVSGFEFALNTANIKSPAEKKCAFIRNMTVEMRSSVESLLAKDINNDESVTYSDIIEQCQQICDKDKNHALTQFRNCKQGSRLLNEWIQELLYLGGRCDFGENLDAELTCQVISGCSGALCRDVVLRTDPRNFWDAVNCIQIYQGRLENESRRRATLPVRRVHGRDGRVQRSPVNLRRREKISHSQSVSRRY